MSVLVKGMEMPDCCSECRFFVDAWCYAMDVNDWRNAYNKPPDGEKLEGCPIIEVPPHGRLIDADELHKLFEEQWHYLQVLDWNENPTAEATQSGINWCINTMHDDAPTVIEAEGVER